MKTNIDHGKGSEMSYQKIALPRISNNNIVNMLLKMIY